MREETVYSEHIDAKTGEYVKEAGVKRFSYRFYLRFIKEHFWPCGQCEKQLEQAIRSKIDQGALILGNKDYEPPIELSTTDDIVDDLWKEIERRKPTEKELETLDKWD